MPNLPLSVAVISVLPVCLEDAAPLSKLP